MFISVAYEFKSCVHVYMLKNQLQNSACTWLFIRKGCPLDFFFVDYTLLVEPFLTWIMRLQTLVMTNPHLTLYVMWDFNVNQNAPLVHHPYSTPKIEVAIYIHYWSSLTIFLYKHIWLFFRWHKDRWSLFDVIPSHLTLCYARKSLVNLTAFIIVVSLRQ